MSDKESTVVEVCVAIRVVGEKSELCGEDCPGAGDEEGECRLFPIPKCNNIRNLEAADDGGWYRCHLCMAHELVK